MAGDVVLAAEQVPPPFSAAALGRGWQFLPLVMIPVPVIGLLYLIGYLRARRQPRPVFPRYRAWCFFASLAALIAADMFGTHFTPFYNLSLENEYIHDCEHLSYLIAGILLWAVILGVDPIRSRQRTGQRSLAVLALMPVMAIIAAVFALAPNPLYPFYPALPSPWGGRAFAMTSQLHAAAVMWLPSPFVTLTALIYIASEKAKSGAAQRRRTAALAARLGYLVRPDPDQRSLPGGVQAGNPTGDPHRPGQG